MRFPLITVPLLAGVAASPIGLADDIPIDIETDIEGDYFIVEKTGPENRPAVIVKQVDGAYVYFIKREFDCDAHEVRYLGEGDSRAAMDAYEPDSPPEMEGIRPGSISDQLAGYVCPKPEPKADAEAEPRSPAE